MIFFTADNHFGHDNIRKFCHRPFSSVEEMDREMIARWNAKVGAQDDVYHLGDFSYRAADGGDSIVPQLNGIIHLVLGNHDTTAHRGTGRILNYDLFYRHMEEHTMSIEGQEIYMRHHPQKDWPHKEQGTWHLHGHCIDLETEILTDSGWKGPDNIRHGEWVYSLNHCTGNLELDKVREVVRTTHTGKVYELDSKSINLRVTNNHTVVSFNRDGSNLRQLTADETFTQDNVHLLRSGCMERRGLDINPLLIKLYILMVADAQAPLATGLVRYRVTKLRKLDYCRGLLDVLKIDYKDLAQGDGSRSLNFYLPEELRNLRIKGMDKFFMRSLSAGQFELVLDAYRYSDGCENGRGTIIYSSKEEEIDLLQELAVTRGYGATKGSRSDHGHSKGESFQLSVYPVSAPTRVVHVKDRIKEQHVENEPFWCIKNGNQNFLCRRRGKVHLTGNSHGASGILPLRKDVGVDTANFEPESWAEIKTYFQTDSPF